MTGIEFELVTPPLTPRGSPVPGAAPPCQSTEGGASPATKGKSEHHVPSEQDLGKPIAAQYTSSLSSPSGTKSTSGTISFTYLIDASGRTGILSTKYLRNRHMNESLKNIACWGYWRGGGVYGRGSERDNAPFFQALIGESSFELIFLEVCMYRC